MNSLRNSFLSAFRLNRFVPLRSYATKKRFYKNTNVLSNEGLYQVALDQRMLKTPKGTLFSVQSEPLAIAVATEWDHQKDKIMVSHMHLTALCFTALDNPNKLNKLDMINYLLNFATTDTVLYQTQDEKELEELEKKEWDPLIEWFNKRYNTCLEKTISISSVNVSASDKMNISKYLSSYSEEILHGFVFAVDTLKSIILAFAVIDQRITVDQAVHLARLEEEYQLKYWGRVEWAHDLSQQELQARLAAAVLFIHLNLSENLIKQKMIF